MITKQGTLMKFLRLFTLGYIGGTIYCLMYIRYVFYDQMLELMGCTNVQLGLLNTVSSSVMLALFLVGPYLADKLDCQKSYYICNRQANSSHFYLCNVCI